MAQTYTLTGDDVIIINDIPLNNLANGDVGSLDLPNNLVEIQSGQDVNTIFAFNPAGKNATLTVRVLMSSADDKRLNGLIPSGENFASTILLTGSVVKQVGDGAGNVSYNTYALQGGMIQKQVNVTANVNGETEQAVCVYTIIFAHAARIIS